MAVRTGTPAPYGPPAGVLGVISGFRDRGLTTPFTADVLMKAGISESLVPRVYKSLEALDLIDAEGNPTPQLIGLRTVKTDDFKAALGEVVRAAYAEVFQFVDPATDDATRIADAFRTYEPAGQRGRMVTLFLGLCEAAGIIKEEAARAKAPTGVGKKKVTFGKSGRPLPNGGAKAQLRGASGGSFGTDSGDPFPALTGLLKSLPIEPGKWSQEQRDKFIKAFGTVLDLYIAIAPTEPIQTGDLDDGDDE